MAVSEQKLKCLVDLMCLDSWIDSCKKEYYKENWQRTVDIKIIRYDN